MRMLTVRLEDDVHDDLVRSARERGTTVSEIARQRIGDADQQARPTDSAGRIRFPDQLTTVERHGLSLLHRILAEVVKDGDPEHNRANELELAMTLEQGFVPDYEYVFASVEDAISRQDAGLVMDILDMFTFLELSYDALDPAARAELDAGSIAHLQFSGFDYRNDTEGRLLRYARHLIDQGRWENLAHHFGSDHGDGISGFPSLPVYLRMREVFEPIWREKCRLGSALPRSEAYLLTADEIGRVARAAIHPDHR